MRRRTRSVAVLNVAAVLAGSLMWRGCCTPSEPPATTELEPVEMVSTGLSRIGRNALTSARGTYNGLLAGKPADQARTELVSTLNNHYPGVLKAALFADGHTVFMRFTDGTHGALSTYDFAAARAQAQEEKDEAAAAQKDAAAEEAPTRQTEKGSDIGSRSEEEQPQPDPISTPESQDAIFLNYMALTDPDTQEATEDGETALITAGWREIFQVDVKERTSYEDPEIGPYELLHGLDEDEDKEYGIIVITAMGVYGTPGEVAGAGSPGADDTNSYYYIQAGSNIDYSEAHGQEFQDELSQYVGEGKIIVLSRDNPISGNTEEELLIRSDLLGEQINDLPNSQVILISPYGWEAKDAFMESGCGEFFSWDGNVFPPRVDGPTIGIVEDMSGDDPMSGDEALADLQSSTLLFGEGLTDPYTGETSHFRHDSGGTEFYYPAEIAVDVASARHRYGSSAEYFVFEVTYTDPRLAGETVTFEYEYISVVSPFAWLEGILPFEATLTVAAFDGPPPNGKLVGTGRSTHQLSPGSNWIDIEPCDTMVVVNADWVLQDSPLDEIAEMAVTLDYDTPGIPTESWRRATGHAFTNEGGLPVGKGTAHVDIYAADGRHLGSTSMDFDLDCYDEDDYYDRPSVVDACFGYVRLEAFSPSDLPPDTHTIQVTQIGDEPEKTARFSPDGAANMFGFEVGEEVTLRMEALDEEGNVLAETSHKEDIECGENLVDTCFGYAEFELGNIPPDTATITASHGSGEFHGAQSVTFPVTEPGRMYNLGLVPALTLEAFGPAGQPLGRTELDVDVTACGATPVKIDILSYGIILTAAPAQVAADGQETSLITAELREFQEGDLLAPTGDPVAGKEVEFDTNLGGFIGPNPAVTDASGIATIQIASTTEGKAIITAFVMAELEQAQTAVRFGEPPEQRTRAHMSGSATPIVGWGDDILGEEHWINWRGFDVTVYLNGVQQGGIHRNLGGGKSFRLMLPDVADGDLLEMKFEATPPASVVYPSEIGPMYIHYYLEDNSEHTVVSWGTLSATVEGTTFQKSLTVEGFD